MKEIQNEKIYLRKIMNKSEFSIDELDKFKIEIRNLYILRIHNLIITIDKIRNFWSMQNFNDKNEKPIKFLQPNEYIDSMK